MTELLDMIAPENLIEFALANGWHRGADHPGSVILHRADNDLAESVVPIDRAFLDFRQAMRRSAENILKHCQSRDDAMTALLPGYDPVHNWFELSYAQYLTIPRSVLQSMPAAWQHRFVKCLEELDDAIDWRPEHGRYWVSLKNDKGRFVRDPLQDYERGRRRIARKATP